MICFALLSLLALTSAAPQYAAPAPAAVPAYAPPPPAPRPAPVYAAPPVPKAVYGPPAAAYGVPNKEGGELLSEFAPAPIPAAAPIPAPSPNYGTPNKEGGELLSEEVAIPPNTRVHLTDDRNQYSHGFSDDKGTQVAEQGHLITTNGGWEYVLAKKGSYSYISPEGIPVSVHYIADENGFRIVDQLP